MGLVESMFLFDDIPISVGNIGTPDFFEATQIAGSHYWFVAGVAFF